MNHADLTTITVYGLRTERRIQAIKTLRGVFEAIHGMPLGLREAKLTCDALQDRDDAQIVIRCETKLAGLVRTALSAADFRLHQPERETILYV
jgi:hypothetical protein